MEPWDTIWAEVWIWNSPVVTCERGGSLKPFQSEIRFFQLIHVLGASPFLAMVTVKLAEALHADAQWSRLEGPNGL